MQDVPVKADSKAASARRFDIDNLRTLCNFLLLPFHTAMIFNNWNEVFYVNGAGELLPSLFVVIVYPWWMTLLFTIAGIASAYAMKRKTAGEYIKERVKKLLIPLLSGLLLLIPAQTYIADLFHNGYQGSYLEHLKIFFTKFTNLTGIDGGFTPAHLWFLLYLFVISVVFAPLMRLYLKSKKKLPYEKINIFILISLFFLVLICTPILEAGKSVGESAACFAIGFLC